MAAKNDEFYTRREDIDNELRHYKHYFKDKIVLCNCDDPYESNFFKYFASNFNYLGLKKLICTCYDSSPVAGQQLELFPERNPYKIEITEVSDENGDGAVDLSDVEYLLKNKKNVLKRLKSGDFRSDECIEILKECDVVVTNPPFSLFREFVAQITNYKKDFVIIGNTNALTYKEIFKLFQADRIRTGYTNFNVGMYFYVPEAVEKYHKIENGRKMVRVSTSCWFTSLPVKKHTEDLILYQKYSPDIYQKYDNYDAININTYTDIPYDYEGEMGVPVTFLDKYNPDQFEILGMAASAGYKKEIVGIDFLGHKDARPLINGKNTYARVFIRKKR